MLVHRDHKVAIEDNASRERNIAPLADWTALLLMKRKFYPVLTHGATF